MFQQQSAAIPMMQGKPVLRPKIQLGKNLICLFVAVFAISLASIFIVSRFYANRTKDNIANISLLKDSTFKLWGTEPNIDNNTYQKSYRLYNYTGDTSKTTIDANQFALINDPFVFNYSFQYINATFSQGNVGEVNFVNEWALNPEVMPDGLPINNLNLAINKVFYQFTEWPIQRKFPIMFKNMVESLKEQFLPQFYTKYLYEFFFKKQQIVRDTVLTPLGFSKQVQDKIIGDEDYGWVQVKGLQPWMKLCLSKIYDTAEYSNIIKKIGLTTSQIMKLIGNQSTMYHLTMALNATIKTKLGDGTPDIKYSCADTVCSNDELIASQWAVSFLTKKELMPGINLDESSKDLNSTFPADIEFSQYCTNNNISNTISIASAVPLLVNPDVNLLSIQTINHLVLNKDSPDVLDQYLDTPGNGLSIVKYITEYFYDKLNKNGLSDEQFTWVWMTYQNFNERFGIFKNFMITQYLSRAFETAYKGLKCSDYFSGEVLGDYADKACNSANLNITSSRESYFPYIRAYFFDQRLQFRTSLNMTQQDCEYLFNSPDSLFAKQISQILTTLSTLYKCQSALCSDMQLAYRQWGSNDIMSNLPPQYFNVTSATLLSWDAKNIFNGVPTEYALYNGRKIEYERVKSILSYDNDGILGLFSLLKKVKGDDSEQIIPYLGNVLLGQAYGKLIVKKKTAEYLLGYVDPLLEIKSSKESIDGGTPWEEPVVSLISTNNKKEISMLDQSQQCKINTGIYDQSFLRNWKAVNGRYKTGYNVEIDKLSLDQNLLTWIDTGRPITGTNVLGFKPKITDDMKLQIYWEPIRQTIDIKFQQQLPGDYNIYRFVFPTVPMYIGKDTLDNQLIRISPDSYIDIEYSTGQTTNLHLLIEHSTNSKSLLYSQQDITFPLYQQQIEFARANLARYDGLASDTHTNRTCNIVFIVLCSFSAVMIGVLGFFVWRWRKGLIRLEEDREFQRGVIRTGGIDSQITDGSFS